MEKNEYRKNALVMIYLVSCALNNKAPDKEKLKDIDLVELYDVSRRHLLAACVSYALESAGIRSKEFVEAKEKAIRKNILLVSEQKKLLSVFEQEKIWYMPLKGALLHNWYPRLGMRQMSDIDILCDSSRMKQVRDIFLDNGYTCEHFGQGNHDVYFKQPVLNFEMHSSLFASYNARGISEYFDNVKERLIQDENSSFGYHFGNEDLYLYVISHEYKHFSNGGTGVRSLADTYVMLKKFGDTLDRKYLTTELDKLGIADFELKNRELALKLFDRKKLTDEDKKLLNYFIFSESYGNLQNSFNNDIKRHGGSKLRYVFCRIFPPYDYLQVTVPWAKKSKLLIPAAYIYRIFRAPFINSSKIKAELRLMKNKK